MKIQYGEKQRKQQAGCWNSWFHYKSHFWWCKYPVKCFYTFFRGGSCLATLLQRSCLNPWTEPRNQLCEEKEEAEEEEDKEKNTESQREKFQRLIEKTAGWESDSESSPALQKHNRMFSLYNLLKSSFTADHMIQLSSSHWITACCNVHSSHVLETTGWCCDHLTTEQIKLSHTSLILQKTNSDSFWQDVFKG